ncbi:MAG: DUF1573 domain-containing protein [Muribaculaceae bacterium]|jgi:opacity protein-like surface antigen|uniref:DUF1573 domain-containing protein n=1 Tax=uncultured Duncaniella sp. TaxID=2768039 RepID=UPI00262862E7|nr:DUF1573 domain-containing protein [uncultured Duncaniella sp.]MCX4311831.1 DUF1573 domain-containing protein [Muribaculaceae bacterium]
MKSFLFFAVLAVAGCGVCAAADDAVANGVEWLGTSHDFGAFDESMGVVETEFRFVNRGDEPVVILAARANCGCTTPRYRRDAVAPGDTASVVVGFNPSGRVGRFEKYVYVDTNTGGGGCRQRQRLSIGGVVIGSSNTLRSRFPVDAGALKLQGNTAALGRVKKGRMTSCNIRAYNQSGDTVVARVEGLPRYIKAYVRPERVPPGEMANVYFSFNTIDCKDCWGIVADSAFLRVDGQDGRVLLESVAIVEEDFSKMTPGQREKAPRAVLECDRVDFGRMPVADSVMEGSVRLSNGGRSALAVRRVYTADRGVSVSVDRDKVKRGGEAVIRVSVNPSELAGDLLNARIQVITNDPDNPVQTLRAVGELERGGF